MGWRGARLQRLRSILAAVALGSALAAGQAAEAGDFYVDPVVGSDETGDGSQAAPWLTIQHAFDSIEGTAADPHTVHLAPGVYSRDTNGEAGVEYGSVNRIRVDAYESIIGNAPDRSFIDIAAHMAIGSWASSLGASVWAHDCSPLVEECVFAGKLSGAAATGVGTSVFKNCAFYNSSTGFLATFETTTPQLRNCILSANRIQVEGPYQGAPRDVTYSLVEGGYPGEGNIDADPRWIDPLNGDFRLRWDSPCIDAGDPNDPVPPGGGSRIDMGAFEYQFLPIPAVTGLVFDDAEGGDGDGIPEAGEVVRGRITVTNYGEPARALSATLVFEDPSIIILDGEADFPDLASGESGQTLSDGFAWRVPGDWPQAGPVEMVLSWTSAEGAGSERCWVTLNGTDVWVAVSGDDETGLGTRAAPWRTLRHALVSVHGTHLQPITVHLEEGTYSVATNGEVFPIRPRAHERLKGEWTTARPVIDNAGSGQGLLEASEGSDIVDLQFDFTGENGEGSCNFRRSNADVIGCRLIGSSDSYRILWTERSLYITGCTSNAPIGGADSIIIENELNSVSLMNGILQHNRLCGGLVDASYGAAQILDNINLPDDYASAAFSVYSDATMAGNIILEDAAQFGGLLFEHNYLDGLWAANPDGGFLFCSSGTVRNNILVSRRTPAEMEGNGGSVEFNNNVVLPREVGVLLGWGIYVSIDNVTIFSESETAVGGIGVGTGGAAEVNNSIVWTPATDISGAPARYCCVEDGVLPGPGNISADPLLIGAGHSTDLTPFSLVDETAHWPPGILKGLRLNPNLAQHETLLVDTNTADEIFVIGDPRELASIGDAYLVPWMKLQSMAEGWPADSPCIDAGDPDPACNDPDGSRNDMGAWGGPHAEGHYSPTPSPTPTASPTATGSPATTPTPSPTPTATPATTATPTPEPALGVSLWMPAHEFAPGDLCALFATVENPGPPLSLVPLFVVLEVYGEYWFAPSWPHWPEGGLNGYFLETLPVGAHEIRVIEPFTWPEGAGSASGLFFHAALTDLELTTVLGEPASWEFEFGP